MRTILLNLRYKRLSSLSFLVALLLSLVSVAETSAPRASGRIDYFIGVALKDAGIKPSRSASDAEFLRRVYLDLTGHLPTPDEALKFIQSGRRNKRVQLIDALIESEDYLDHWAVYWSNLLVTRTPSGQVNRRAFEAWIRRALQENMPYHEFVTKLLTAEGANNRNGATNFVLNYNLSPVDLTAKTARTFLGIPMQCAQCHDHKTEKWTQEDFYRYASFFTDMKQEPIKDPQDENRTIGWRVVRRKPRDLQIPDGDDKVSARFINGETPGPKQMVGRKALSAFMVNPADPYFSRAIVNRLWAYFLGRGFVEPVDGFGYENRPSHPKLLDWLADDFVQHDYDLRYLMRVILNSETYQRSSATNKSNREDERLFSHARLRPLAPEQLFNALLQSTGFERLQKRRNRDRVEQLRREYRERFVYVFGNNDMDSQVESFAGTIPQALMLINGTLVSEGSQWTKGNNLDRILQRSRTDGQKIKQIYLLTLCRKPTRSEISYFQRYMRGYTEPRMAYEDLFWSLLNSSEFVYNH